MFVRHVLHSREYFIQLKEGEVFNSGWRYFQICTLMCEKRIIV